MTALRLPTTRDRFAEIAASARREQQSYLGYLADLVIAECEGRDRRRAEQRIRDAGGNTVNTGDGACPGEAAP